MPLVQWVIYLPWQIAFCVVGGKSQCCWWISPSPEAAPLGVLGILGGGGETQACSMLPVGGHLHWGLRVQKSCGDEGWGRSKPI